MSSITVEFEFEIGDLVFFKGAQHTAGHRPKQFVVYERIAQQCHGGVQKRYRVGGITELVVEPLLVRDEPPYRATTQESIDDHIAAVHAEQAASEAAWAERLAARRKKETDSDAN